MARDEADRDDRDDDDRPRRRKRDDDRDDRDDDRDDDDRPRRRRRSRDDDDGEVLGGLIPYKNGMALAAYYCGVFSLIPGIGLILGPMAIIFGFMGLGRAKRHPQAKGKGHSIAGIVLGGLVTLAHVVGLVVVIVAVVNAKAK